jgi:adenosine deaminase
MIDSTTTPSSARTTDLRCTINTDNRLITSTTINRKLLLYHQNYGFTLNDVKEMLIAGFKSAFLPFHERRAMLRAVAIELEQLEREFHLTTGSENAAAKLLPASSLS